VKCPDCGYDNVAGSDECQECGGSLVSFDPQGSDVERSLVSHPISVLCPRAPIVVAPSASVRSAIAQMAEHNIGCVLVEQGAELVGIFSERDVLNKVVDHDGALDQPVENFMTRHPTTVTRRDSIAFALQTMDLGGYRHLPIVNSAGIAIGLLSVRDILRFLCVRYAQTRA